MAEGKRKERIYYFDTFRFLAAMLVFTTHYIGAFCPGYFGYFYTFPYSIFLGGLSGKLGFSSLCIILGLFAYRKGEKSKENLLLMFLQRYLYFLVSAVCFYIPALLLHFIDMHVEGRSVISVFLEQSFKLKYDFYHLFWCLMPMLLGSGICYLLGRVKAGYIEVILMLLIFMILKQEWVAVSIAGAVLYLVSRDQALDAFLKKPWVQLILVFVPFALTHQGPNESFLTDYLGALFAFCFILVTMKNRRLCAFFNAGPWRLVNRTYFGIYILHVLVYSTLGMKLFNETFVNVAFAPRSLLVYAILVVLLILLARPVDFCINSISKGLNILTGNAYHKAVSFYNDKRKRA